MGAFPFTVAYVAVVSTLAAATTGWWLIIGGSLPAMTRDPSCAPLRFGGWICDDCGVLNDAEDASCECEREAERREDMRRAIIARHENLSPAERRARLSR